MDREKQVGDALSQRLGMQISLSSIPIVEEWMDDRLHRWLESVPLPVEMAATELAELDVSVATDLQRLRWSAHGSPPAFIPKLAKYLEFSSASPGDLETINAIGESFEPDHVGSWIQIVPGTVTTGWRFVHSFELEKLRRHLPVHIEPLADWLSHRDLDIVNRIEGAVGSREIVLSTRLGESRSWQEDVDAAFAQFSIPVPTADFFANRDLEEVSLITRTDESGATAVGARFTGLELDDIAALANALGLERKNEISPLMRALGASGPTSSGYFRFGDAVTIEASFRPGNGDAKPAVN